MEAHLLTRAGPPGVARHTPLADAWRKLAKTLEWFRAGPITVAVPAPELPSSFPMGPVIRGRVQSGTGQAARWLSLFNGAYARKLGMPIFAGSLNVALDQPFDWFDPRWQHAVVEFNRAEYGGERDILLLPCSLNVAPGVPASLWSTTTAARDPADRLLAEVIAPVGLRATYGLADGDLVAIELKVEAT